MRRNDAKSIILRMLKNRGMNGYEMSRQLQSKDIRTDLTSLYRILKNMEKEGYTESEWRKSSFGPKKRVYKLTEKGRGELNRMLREAIITVHDFYQEYLAQLPSQKSLLQKLSTLLSANMKVRENVLIVAPKVFYEWMVSSIYERVGRVYLIKPTTMKIAHNYSNLTILEGSTDNIPLRENFADGIRVHGALGNTDNALRELSRVLKGDGVLAVVTPYFSRRSEEPLTFAEFIEKVEQEISAEDKLALDYESFKSQLTNFFHKVRTYRLGHLAIFIAKWKL